MESLRQRIPFNANTTDATGEDDRILDEQEQEQVTAELRDKAARLDKRIYRQTQLYVSISSMFYVILFFRLSLLDGTPIVFARLFALIQILVHANLLLHLTPNLDTVVHRFVREVPRLPLPISWTLGISGLAPLMSLVSGKGWQQTGSWGVATVMTGMVWIMLDSVQESKASLDRLEKLKYDAKGA